MIHLIRILALCFLAITPFSARAAATCESCMSECPHITRDFKPCDRGCPGVCKKGEAAVVKKAQSCRACLSECPHVTRDLKACDRGCTEECDRETLLSLLQQNTARKGCGWDDAAKSKKVDKGSFRVSPDLDDGWDTGGAAGAQ